MSGWRLIKHPQNGIEVLVLLMLIGARLVLHVDEFGYYLVAVEAMQTVLIQALFLSV